MKKFEELTTEQQSRVIYKKLMLAFFDKEAQAECRAKKEELESKQAAIAKALKEVYKQENRLFDAAHDRVAALSQEVRGQRKQALRGILSNKDTYYDEYLNEMEHIKTSD